MSVIFESTIKLNKEGNGWMIELKDAVDGTSVNCNNLEEYEKSIEEMGKDYGGQIDEVKWSVDENVPPYFINEVKLQMAKYQEEHLNDTHD